MRIALGVLLGLVVASAQAEHYGAALTMKSPLSLEAAVKQLDDKSAADVLVESQVDKVCEQKGCWLALKSGSSLLHVTFTLRAAGTRVRVISARPMHRKERKAYEDSSQANP